MGWTSYSLRLYFFKDCHHIFKLMIVKYILTFFTSILVEYGVIPQFNQYWYWKTLFWDWNVHTICVFAVRCLVRFTLALYKDSLVRIALGFFICNISSIEHIVIFYTAHFNEAERGEYWFHVIRPSVCSSVCGQNHVCFVSSIMLARCISYLHISPSNLRRCVMCKDYCKILKF